ncbi:MAG: alpha/beta fold hydrolase [Candidatus Aegiribacteria sp.]|nr:alpha/beta fold hydrolase [Candidatus Aegiribacteria sp.]
MIKKLYTAGVLFFLCILAACGQATQVNSDISGAWEGSISLTGIMLDINVDITVDDTGSYSASIDIPVQGASGLELVNVFVRGDSVEFVLPSNLGEASFAGRIDGDLISGVVSQGGVDGDFELRRGSEHTSEHTMEEIHYTAIEVTITGEDVSLAGTLTIPEGAGPFPAVILLTGSGIQDRDESVMGFRVFGELADHLTRSDIAVLRCDDRGFGGSIGEIDHLTDSVFACDASLMLDYMLGQPDIDPDRIGILGHSEGSTVAFITADWKPEDVAFIVSMAGPSISGYDVLLGQIEMLCRQAGLTEAEIARNVEAQKTIMDIILAGDDHSGLDEMFRTETVASLEDLSEEELAALGDIDVYVDYVVAQSISQVESDWFLNFLQHDPAVEISVVSCPVLALYGSLDIQVPPERNLESMQMALSENPLALVMVIDGANHLFQASVDGMIEEYAALEPELTDGFESTVSDWILDVTR